AGSRRVRSGGASRRVSERHNALHDGHGAIRRRPLWRTRARRRSAPPRCRILSSTPRFSGAYVERVSDGQVTLRSHLRPEIVQVSGRMGDYAPTGPYASSDTELAKLAALVEEAWSLADQQIDFDLSGFDPERTAFLIFHA